ncbi:MAG: 30S ribosomal protein S7 [Patescibacteria group bacterium]
MPRSGKVKRVPIKLESLYKSPLVSKLINRVMIQGKKSTAVRIVYSALNSLSTDKTEAKNMLKTAVDNVTPAQEVKARRVGGATYQVPSPVRYERAESLALRWIVRSAQMRKGIPMAEKLAAELQDILKGTGAAMKKKEEMHRMAEANKAFAHFRWGA